MERRGIGVSGKLLLVLLVFAGAALALPMLGGGADQASPDPTTRALALDLDVSPTRGSLAPDFSLQTVDGETVQLSALRGRPVLINLWATWCAPCRLEMPYLQDRFERYQDQGLAVLAVNFDESSEQVAAFRDELGLTFDLLLDPGAQVQRLYLNRSYPASFFIDPRGVIQVHHLGVMTESQLDENLSAIGLGG